MFSFFTSGTFKWVLIGGAFITLLIMYYTTALEVKDLELERARQDQIIAALQDSTVHLQGTVDEYMNLANNKQQEVANIQDLLNKCYEDKAEHQQYLDEISHIMQAPEVAESTKNETKEIVRDEVHVTTSQVQQGLNFINRQYDRILSN